MANNFSTFYKTFSGSDTLVFIIFPNATPILFGSLTTISYSTYRIKKPVNTLSRVNVSGFTRGNRIVAGTMIFTLINQHWLNETIDILTTFKKFESLKPDELPLFDLMIVSANEYGSSIIGNIYGVDITDDSGVVSINDYYTETTVSFMARDIDLFKTTYESNANKVLSKHYSTVINNYTASIKNLKNISIKSTPIKINENTQMLEDIEYMNDVECAINNINFDLILKNYNEICDIDIYTKSYYQCNKTNVYTKTLSSSNITVMDIISSFVFDVETNSFPKNIDCLLKVGSNTTKFNIKLVS